MLDRETLYNVIGDKFQLMHKKFLESEYMYKITDVVVDLSSYIKIRYVSVFGIIIPKFSYIEFGPYFRESYVKTINRYDVAPSGVVEGYVRYKLNNNTIKGLKRVLYLLKNNHNFWQLNFSFQIDLANDKYYYEIDDLLLDQETALNYAYKVKSKIERVELNIQGHETDGKMSIKNKKI